MTDTSKPCTSCGESWDYHIFRDTSRTPDPSEITYSPECPPVEWRGKAS